MRLDGCWCGPALLLDCVYEPRVNAQRQQIVKAVDGCDSLVVIVLNRYLRSILNRDLIIFLVAVLIAINVLITNIFILYFLSLVSSFLFRLFEFSFFGSRSDLVVIICLIFLCKKV